MSEAFLKLVNMSISAGWLVLAVLALRLILKKAPKWVHVLLWGIVAFRLICPFTIESALSLIPSTQTISPEIMMDWTPEISTGIEPLDQVVNPVISTSFAPEPSASANPLQILIPVTANIWLLGVLAMLLYTAVSYISLRLKLRTAVILRDNIFQCETVHSPFVLGILKPRIYLPYTVGGVNLYHVMAHERAHIRRKDHWWKPLGFLLLSVYWFNPLMWVAYVLLCRDIELACDEKVIAQLGNDQRADYTQALVACSVNRRRLAACPLAFGEVGVKERVKSIMNYRKPAFWVILLALIACAAVAVCFLTDPVDPAEDALETDGMVMHQTSFPYATEDGYYLLIGTDGVKEIQVSLPDSGGGVVNADGSLFEKGEKVWLEHLQNVTDLRGLSITALGEDGEVLYGLSIPEDASTEDVINTVGGDGWLLAPTEHIVGPTMDEITDQLHELQKLESEQESSTSETVQSTYENYNVAPLEELPDTYTLEEATIDKCVMVFDGEIRDNSDVWQTFCVQTSKGQSTTVRIVHYYHGTDSSPSAMYIFDLTYDGKSYELRWFEDGKEYIEHYQYLRYFDGIAEHENAAYDAYKSYILTNDTNATRQELLLSYASSAHGAAIPHFEVFADYIVYPDYPEIPAELLIAELYNAHKFLYSYLEEKTLVQLQSLLANAQGLGYEPKTYDVYCNLFLTGADGSTVTIGLDALHDLFVIDGVFFDYGPGYDDHGSVDATQKLLSLLGLKEWPERIRISSVQELYEDYVSRGYVGSHIYVDLDNDGVEELFIYRPVMGCTIATIADGRAVTAMNAKDLFLCEGGAFGWYMELDGGHAVVYYKLVNHKAVTVDVIMTTLHDDAWYHSSDPNIVLIRPQNMTRISKEEAKKISDLYAIAEENIPTKLDYLTWLYGEE